MAVVYRGSVCIRHTMPVEWVRKNIVPLSFCDDRFSRVLKGMGHRVFHCSITYDMLYGAFTSDIITSYVCVLHRAHSRDLIKFIVLLVKVNM